MRLVAEGWKNKFQTLIVIIMSARNRDEVTINVARKLFSKYSTALALSRAKLNNIKTIIKPVNFYINKSKNILRCAKILVKNYNSVVPDNIDELIKLS